MEVTISILVQVYFLMNYLIDESESEPEGLLVPRNKIIFFKGLRYLQSQKI